MATLTSTPRLIKGGLVLIDPDTGQVQRVISLQYNPDTLSRTLQVQGMEGEGGNRTEALRLKGPAIETIRVEIEIDATDDLEHPEEHATTGELGLHGVLAALELIVQPSSRDLVVNDTLASMGSIEIITAEKPLALFVWSQQRVLPVRITEFSITEEAFDPSLNPIRVRIHLSMRVLTVDDLGFTHKGGSLFLSYLQRKERLAERAPRAELNQLGLGSIG